MGLYIIPPAEAYALTPLVAVYGTLKRGYCNHRLLKGSKFLGEGYALGKYELFDAGFPYAVPSERDLPLKVEVYSLASPRVLKRLDLLEGYPIHYLRKPEEILLKSGEKLTAWLYYALSPEGERITETFFDRELGIEYLKWDRN